MEGAAAAAAAATAVAPPAVVPPAVAPPAAAPPAVVPPAATATAGSQVRPSPLPRLSPRHPPLSPASQTMQHGQERSPRMRAAARRARPEAPLRTPRRRRPETQAPPRPQSAPAETCGCVEECVGEQGSESATSCNYAARAVFQGED
eukprot:365745-Chlamydomonas_euryale.AAC.7